MRVCQVKPLYRSSHQLTFLYLLLWRRLDMRIYIEVCNQVQLTYCPSSILPTSHQHSAIPSTPIILTQADIRSEDSTGFPK